MFAVAFHYSTHLDFQVYFQWANICFSVTIGNKNSVLNAKKRSEKYLEKPLLITSHDTDTQPNSQFSNGNCKLLIAKLSQLKTVLMAEHWHPIPVFSLYLTKKVKEQNIYRILAGDFNFPSTVVKWVNREEGVPPNAKSWNTPEKVAFSLLLEINMISA